MSANYTIIVEQNEGSGFSAYSPDVPNVYATGATEAITRRRMIEGIAAHLRWLRADGDEIPVPHSRAFVERIDA